MFIRKKDLKKNGFTLIELMVVISILLILMGFIVPKFSAYQDKAKRVKAEYTAKQIQTAAMASYGDDNGKFVAEHVLKNITTLTFLSSNDVKTPKLVGDSGQCIEISYNSDGKEYTIDIDAGANTYKFAEDNNAKMQNELSETQNKGAKE
jgi:type IV pilus assembly protein PilA